MNQPELGKKIIELRKAKGLTQEELVEKCNLSVRTLQRVESGEVMPRSYTIKVIFTALDFNIYDSSLIIQNRFSKTEFVITNWLEQFYRYVLDLFNLKTKTMKKITILSIAFSIIACGLFAIVTKSRAQINDKSYNIVNESKPSEDFLSNKMDLSLSCKSMWTENDEIIGSDIKFTWKGVSAYFSLLKLNRLTHEFRSGLIQKGTFFPDKVDVTVFKRVLHAHMINYTAEKVEKSGEKIHLIGNAKLTSTDDTIATNEIIITTITPEYD